MKMGRTERPVRAWSPALSAAEMKRESVEAL
jgi:hypothetical protein